MKSIKPVFTAAFLSLSALAFSANAQTAAPATNNQADTEYKAAMKRCDSLNGNQKDVCEKEAKAARETAKADNKQAKEQAEARHDATKEKRAAEYDVAKEKCDAMSGDAKDACMADAKTRFGK